MAEYINRERARFEAERYFKNMDEIKEDLDMLFCMLPAEDVSPVRHGRWRYFHKQNIAVCTECSFERNLDTNFGRAVNCPNCGAKMD